MTGSVYFDGVWNRPKIIINSNRGTLDFQKYNIYKSKASTGWTYVYCGTTTGNEFIDNTEYILTNGSGDAPPPNCYYSVKTVDLTNQASNLSNQLGYRVGISVCPNCPVGDNTFVNLEQTPESQIESPSKFNLNNFPNPFNPTTKIYYTLPLEGIVKITIYNSVGQEVKLLLNEFKLIGSYTVDFDGSDFSSGIYYYRLESNNLAITNKMLLIK